MWDSIGIIKSTNIYAADKWHRKVVRKKYCKIKLHKKDFSRGLAKISRRGNMVSRTVKNEVNSLTFRYFSLIYYYYYYYYYFLHPGRIGPRGTLWCYSIFS